jgi:hypothetical protein
MNKFEKLLTVAVAGLVISVICLWLVVLQDRTRIADLQAVNKDLVVIVYADDSALRVLLGMDDDAKPISQPKKGLDL